MKATFNLSERAMLADLNISVWLGRREDKRATEEVARKHGVDSRVGKFTKNVLLPEDDKFTPAKELKAVHNMASSTRANIHHANTLPWSQDGPRILPAENYVAWKRAMESEADKFNELVTIFVAA